MYTVVIADDELIIRQGLKCIINWEELGFSVIAEASNGEDALNIILDRKPDLVLLDIRMPKMLGIDVVQEARHQGYNGKFIILSGFTDFEYAQAAIKYGVNYYLTKPIDEDELFQTVTSLRDAFDAEAKEISKMEHYRSKAKNMILIDILTNKAVYSQINPSDMNLEADKYQVVIYEKYSHHADQLSYRFSDLLKVTNEQNSSYENITIDKNEILLLKGTFTLQKFQEFLEHYEREQKPQKDSPLDSLFITYGCAVDSLEKVPVSYAQALRLLQRRFFCEYRQHTIGYENCLTVIPISTRF